MKKRIFLLILAVFSFSLCACSNSEETKALNNYKNEMEAFFTDLEGINSSIEEINVEADDAMNILFDNFDSLEKSFINMAALEVPTKGAPETFSYIEELADEASEYMIQANDYMHQSFSDSSYNEYTLEGAMECYKRANKRVLYIIDLLHGEYPKDENISYN